MGASAHESQGQLGPAVTGETPVILMGKMPMLLRPYSHITNIHAGAGIRQSYARKRQNLLFPLLAGPGRIVTH
jgi:hypothetical protein